MDENKISEQLKFGQFFVHRLNQHYGLDYRAESNMEEEKKNTEVDVYANSDKHKTLKLQLVTRDGYVFSASAEMRKESRSASGKFVFSRVMNVQTEKWIDLMLKQKDEAYSPEVKKDMILLITGKYGVFFDKSYACTMSSRLNNRSFKGIYLVHLLGKNNGQVIAIKNIFGKDGEVF